MSRVRADKLVDRNATGAPQFTYGAELPVGYGFTGAGGINVSGFGTFGGVNGSWSSSDLTVRNVTGVAATFTGAVSYEDVTNVDSAGIVTARGGFKAGSPTGVGATIGVDNAGDAIFSGIVTAGTCFKAGSVSGGAFGAGVGVTITGDGNAVFSGITTVTHFDAKGTLVEAFSSTTTAWSSSADLNISNGNIQFSSANLGGTNNTLNIYSTTGINTDLAVNQTLTVTGITAVNATTAYVNKITVDGVATGITTHWVGGEIPSEGGDSGVDLYTFNLLKTGNSTYIIVANHSKTSS